MAIKLNMCVLSKIVLDLKNSQKAMDVAKLNEHLGNSFSYLFISMVTFFNWTFSFFKRSCMLGALVAQYKFRVPFNQVLEP